MMPIYEYVCGNLHTTDHLHRTSDGPRPETRECERCGKTAAYVESAPNMRIARTNFYDRGAGRTFKDEAEMKQWCKANGTSEDNGGGRFWFEERERARNDAIARDEAKFAEYEDKLNNSPDFAFVREYRDRGFFADRARRALERSGVNRSDKVLTEIPSLPTRTP